MTFLTFCRKNIKRFIFPIVAPVVVFAVSAVATNGGWMLLYGAVITEAVMVGLTTLEMYNKWYIVKTVSLMRQKTEAEAK